MKFSLKAVFSVLTGFSVCLLGVNLIGDIRALRREQAIAENLETLEYPGLAEKIDRFAAQAEAFNGSGGLTWIGLAVLGREAPNLSDGFDSYRPDDFIPVLGEMQERNILFFVTQRLLKDRDMVRFYHAPDGTAVLETDYFYVHNAREMISPFIYSLAALDFDTKGHAVTFRHNFFARFSDNPGFNDGSILIFTAADGTQACLNWKEYQERIADNTLWPEIERRRAQTTPSIPALTPAS